MAEVKNTKEAPIRVIAGTFPAACGDYAKKLKDRLEEAGMKDFKVEQAKDMPGYIMVSAERGSRAEAEQLIEQAAAKKIRLSM
mgnify:FL=1